MKKFSLIIATIILSGCAMGINQSVAVIEGKPYLVEKKTYVMPILPFIQWSDDEPQTTPLEIKQEDKKNAAYIMDSIVNICKYKYSRDYAKITQCIEARVMATKAGIDLENLSNEDIHR